MTVVCFFFTALCPEPRAKRSIQLILLRNQTAGNITQPQHMLFITDSFNGLFEISQQTNQMQIATRCLYSRAYLCIWTCREKRTFPESVSQGKSERWLLGGGVATRWNDKHVTQNGNNQTLLQTPRQRQGESTQQGTTHTRSHVHSQTHRCPTADIMVSVSGALQDFKAQYFGNRPVCLLVVRCAAKLIT